MEGRRRGRKARRSRGEAEEEGGEAGALRPLLPHAAAAAPPGRAEPEEPLLAAGAPARPESGRLGPASVAVAAVATRRGSEEEEGARRGRYSTLGGPRRLRALGAAPELPPSALGQRARGWMRRREEGGGAGKGLLGRRGAG